MSLLQRTYDYTKEHLELDHDDTHAWCTHCGKTVEERNGFPDYTMFMGGVWATQNLPCKPYDAPTTHAAQCGEDKS